MHIQLKKANMQVIQRAIFIQVFTYCISASLSNIYSIRDVDLRESNELEKSYMILLFYPNNLLRNSMSIPIDKENNQPSTENRADEDTIGDLDLNQKQKEILRKRWRSSCDRKASKVCIKACRSTYKIVCGSYKCRKGMKRSFKRECKSNCKAKFISSKYYSDSE